MSDILVRIPLSGQSDFNALALAPGLPMLDARKLTYQVLLGWFGDMLAEPELDDDGVLFHAQQNGKRQTLVESALATPRDLDGALSGDFEKLKDALFDVRPVSPSERLIFNRLQPPIGNHDGFLYRVRTEGGKDRLVWCWGFQRRNSDGEAVLCPNRECSLLFIQHDPAAEVCSHCEQPLIRPAAVVTSHRRRFPVGAAVATVVLSGLVVGTYWIAATGGEGLPGDFPALAAVEQPMSGDAVSDITASPGDSEEDVVSRSDDQTIDVPSVDVAESVGIELPDLVSDPVIDSEGIDNNGIELPNVIAEETSGSPLVQPELVVADATPQSIDLPEPTLAASDTSESTSIEDETSEEPAADSVPVQLSRDVVDPNSPEVATEEASPAKPPETQLAAVKWHEDYLSAYQEAITKKSRLLMLFRDRAEPDSVTTSTSGVGAPELQPLLEGFVRVVMPVNFVAPGGKAGESPKLLLEHRSFRHLGVRPGIAVVDLTDSTSPTFGRVVSAVHQPENGKYTPEILAEMLKLPAGSVSQRTLLLAVRTSVRNGGVSTLESSPLLNKLAGRNSRLMAYYGKSGSFEQENRQQAVAAVYGEDVELQELVYAADSATSIQEASIQAVQSWLQVPENLDVLSGQIEALGVEMVQSPDSDSWYATILIVRRVQ